MPNTGSTTANQGNIAPKPTESDCKKAEEGNKNGRTKVDSWKESKVERLQNKKDKLQENLDKITDAKAKEKTATRIARIDKLITGWQKKADTVSTMMNCEGSPKTAYSSYQSYLKNNKDDNFFAKGQPPKDRKGGTVLCEEPYNYAESASETGNMMKGGHCEARSLYESMKDRNKGSPPCNLTFKIDWRNSDGNHSIPCPDCFRMMCHAKTNCNVEIYVCNDKNEPEKLEKEECENKQTGYRKFTNRVKGAD